MSPVVGNSEATALSAHALSFPRGAANSSAQTPSFAASGTAAALSTEAARRMCSTRDPSQGRFSARVISPQPGPRSHGSPTPPPPPAVLTRSYRAPRCPHTASPALPLRGPACTRGSVFHPHCARFTHTCSGNFHSLCPAFTPSSLASMSWQAFFSLPG